MAPDIFVVFGVPKHTDRLVFKVWEEGEVPSFVLEVTSKLTLKNDENYKKNLYERLGVTEYWQFDPTGECLDPMLKGRALGPDGRYREFVLEPRKVGLGHYSSVLGLDLRLEGERLRFFSPERGEYCLTPREVNRALNDRERVIKDWEQALKELDRAAKELDRALAERDRVAKELEQALKVAEA